MVECTRALLAQAPQRQAPQEGLRGLARRHLHFSPKFCRKLSPGIPVRKLNPLVPTETVTPPKTDGSARSTSIEAPTAPKIYSSLKSKSHRSTYFTFDSFRGAKPRSISILSDYPVSASQSAFACAYAATIGPR
jgi:hypothetical protein